MKLRPFFALLVLLCGLLPLSTRAVAAVNVAAQANGGVASASSSFAGYPASGANNGDRKGLNWGNGGGWNDSTNSTFPDWLQLTFSSTQSIAEIDVFTVQDNFATPSDPTLSMTFTQYGITDFQVQYWTGSAWLDVPGGNITGNNRVWRRITFSPISTSAIRVLVNGALNVYSRIVELEAWTMEVVPRLSPVNVAAQTNGGIAGGSTAFNASYAASGANNGDRRGLNWGNGGGWNDATANSFPDSLEVSFNGTYSISEIDVFTVQDNFATPSDPTLSMTFTQYGITDFQVQYWTGSAWLDVPAGNVTGNNRVWRRFTFAPINTTAIRVVVNGAMASYARITELEAWTELTNVNSPPAVNLAAPLNNAAFTAPATINLSAAASDSDGTISKVEFYRDATLIATVTTPTSGTSTSGTYTYSDTNVNVGVYSYSAIAYDASDVTSSAGALVSVTAARLGSVNVAAQANGGVATASSAFHSGYAASGANNGDRKGLSWGDRGGWNDATADTFPDSLQVSFNGTYSIGEIDVFTVQDNFSSPAEPTPSMTFSQYGVTAFQVQYWNGSTWIDVPGGNVTGNNLVWRRIVFSPVITDAIRVAVNSALAGYSRIVEVEAWTGAPPSAPPPASLQQIASGFSSPVGIENARDGSGRLFIVQQSGQIRIISGGSVLPTPYLDIAPFIVSGGEQGFLGLAFDPNYANNGFFYVNYTRQPDGATVIARYQRSSNDPNRADPNSGSTLLTVAQPFANHNGGQLRFGPDGYLYIGLGDGGSGNDPGNRAQDRSTLLGKMLRIDVHNGSPYAIPPSNPFQNDGNPNTLGEIWAYGLRNPWRFSFDRLTGDLFIADVGQNAWEEVDFQAGGTGAGANYGWRVMEANQCTALGGGPACFSASFTPPIVEYGHDLGCSVTGGFRYRGSAMPAMAGVFLYGDFCSGRIWAASQYASGAWASTELFATGFNISTFGEDESGELYVAAYNTGVIYRMSTP
jgi:glucose/arabinose dehydrogenase